MAVEVFVEGLGVLGRAGEGVEPVESAGEGVVVACAEVVLPGGGIPLLARIEQAAVDSIGQRVHAPAVGVVAERITALPLPALVQVVVGNEIAAVIGMMPHRPLAVAQQMLRRSRLQ